MADSTSISILGPTLIWNTGDTAYININNKLTDTTTVHWHGAEVESHFDGGPHEQINPNTSWSIKFPVLDSASTMWYHPHLHNETVEQVQKGLSGMIIVNQASDKYKNVLPHTYGVDDIPVILGDIGVVRTNPSSTNNMTITTTKGSRPTNLVNGVTNPYINLPNALVRLRILNGSTRKGIKFGFTNKYNDPTSSLLTFTLIATDGGYMMNSEPLKMLMNGPGARDEVILDLSSFSPGDTLYMRNLKQLLPKSVVGSINSAGVPGGGGKDTTGGNAFLQIRIFAAANHTMFPISYVPITAVPTVTNSWGVLQDSTNNIAKYRYKNLILTTTGTGTNTSNAYTIDNKTFDMDRIDDTICVNTKEIWTIFNKTPVAHPFHIHKIQFRILEIDSLGTSINLKTRGLNGPKDDVLMLPNWKLRFLGYYDDYPDSIEPMHSYMYHCHILTHEDMIGGGMMHQFVVAYPLYCNGFTTGIDNHFIQQVMMLFPNPSTGDLYLQGEAIKPSAIRMMDAQGRLVKEQLLPVFTGHIKLNTEGLAKGLYMIEWRTNNESHLKKFVLE